MKTIFISLLVFVFGFSAFANCNDFSGKEAKECKKSKAEEAQVKRVMIKAIKDNFKGTAMEKDSRGQAKVVSECIKELIDFCGDRKLYKGCKIDCSSSSCTLWKMNETRTDTEGKKAFPGNMECTKK